MAMRQVGEAATRGGEPDEATYRRLRAVAASDPLRIEPFLVEAAMAERAGDYDRAKQLLLQARSRDPRSVAARYLYADTAVRQGSVLEALQEMAVLSKLMPAASVQLVPALAQFAQAPGSQGKIAALLAQNPQLKNPLLTALAANPDNAELILALAGPPTATPDNDTWAWEARLLRGMVAQGDYQNAYEVWRHFALLPKGAHPLLFNGSFRAVAAPQPFNWGTSGSSAGVVELGPRMLSVLYYGREDAVLAEQLLILQPGTYRFKSPISGTLVAGSLSWTIACVGAKDFLMDHPLGGTAKPSGTFNVPPHACPAQQLQLNGHREDSPKDSNVRIGPASIERIGT
jgi:tetratricopeptide (TPR) repeat protein